MIKISAISFKDPYLCIILPQHQIFKSLKSLLALNEETRYFHRVEISKHANTRFILLDPLNSAYRVTFVNLGCVHTNLVEYVGFSGTVLSWSSSCRVSDIISSYCGPHIRNHVEVGVGTCLST